MKLASSARRRREDRGADKWSAESADAPYPTIRVGPYVVSWQMTSQQSRREGNGPVEREWQAMVRSMPEEVSVTAIPEDAAPGLDLSGTATVKR